MPLPMMPMLTGMLSAAWSSLPMLYGPGVQVVPLEPSVGPVPPPMSVVMPFVRACSACWGAIRWTWVSMALTVAMRCSPHDGLRAGPDDQARVDLVLGLRVAGLADVDDEAVLDPDVALHDADDRVDDHDIGDDGVEGALGAGGLGVGGHAVTHGLATAVEDLVPVLALAVVLLDLDDEVGVAEVETVADRRTEHVGVLLARQDGHQREPFFCLVSFCFLGLSVRVPPLSPAVGLPAVLSSAPHEAPFDRPADGLDPGGVRDEAAVEQPAEADQPPGAGCTRTARPRACRRVRRVRRSRRGC